MRRASDVQALVQRALRDLAREYSETDGQLSRNFSSWPDGSTKNLGQYLRGASRRDQDYWNAREYIISEGTRLIGCYPR